MKRILLLVLLASFFQCCDKNKPPREPDADGRNVLVYIIGDNNLYPDAFKDINEMEAAWNDDINGKMFVFLNKIGGEATLYEIVNDDDPNVINSKVIKKYPNKQNPCDITFFRSVIDETYALYPVKKRGLIMWSHGSGWLPVKYPYNSPLHFEDRPEGTKLDFDIIFSEPAEGGALYSFGNNYTYSKEMEVYDMALALDGLKFDFISFDACYMGCIEVFYQLRSVTGTILASTTEIYSSGAPYEDITELLFAPNIDMNLVAQKCFDYYQFHPDSRYRSSSYTVVNTTKLEALASATKNVVTVKALNSTDIQQFGVSSTFKNSFYDLGDFIRTNWDGSTKLPAFEKALEEAVTFKACTPVIFGTVVITNCGISSYIPKSNLSNTLKTFKERYSWSKDSGLGNIIE